MKNCIVLLVAAGSLITTIAARSQTTLGGDHVVTGNLSVGTSGTHGNLTVTGQTGSSAAPTISAVGDGGVVFSGTLGVGQIPATGIGTRLMWYPKKAAFRAGTLTVANWEDSLIGDASVAFGFDSCASGRNTFATTGGIASGDHSICLGGSTTGIIAVSLNGGDASGTRSIAMNGGFSTGYRSLAWGPYAYATANDSAAFGIFAMATGSSAVSLNGLASGASSAALAGGYSIGINSVAAGQQAQAYSANSTALGRYTYPEGNPSTWVNTDPLLVVGNGNGVTGDANCYRNAFTVYKNGNVKMTGKVEMPRQGDIPMGAFGNPE